MHQLLRSPWTTLTPSQTSTLVEALKMPNIVGLSVTAQYRTISTEFAVRAARLLVMNDLRGALDSAEISRVADAMGEAHERATERAKLRVDAMREIERTDPNGRLVYVPGKKRRVRVMPGEPDPNETQPRHDSAQPRPQSSAR